MKLTIIIPCYNAEPYIDELLKCLHPQLTPDVDVIVVDDGSKTPYLSPFEDIPVIRKENGGAASARNVGIENADGEYIAFIDADDLVSKDYVKKLLEKIEEGFDVCEFSWKTLGNGTYMDFKLNSQTDRLKNPSACTRCFRKEFICETRFNECKDAVEDEEFSRAVGYIDQEVWFKRAVITDYLYFYRTYVEGSNTKRFKQGLTKSKRITYYFHHVTADMTDLLEEIKQEDKYNEVWLLTYKCDIPKLKRWCQISEPFHIWTHYLRGEPYSNCEIIEPPIQAQVVLYIKYLHIIGGIESFVYNFVKTFSKTYDIALVVETIADKQFERISNYIRIIKKPTQSIICDTLILLRILDEKPKRIEAKKTVRMVHACRTNPMWCIPDDSDVVIHCSEVSRESFNAPGNLVIHNPFHTDKKKALFLISATRIPAPDKGKNEWRMMKLAEMLNKADIPFIWLNFSEGKLDDAPKGFYNMGIEMDIQPYIAKADYLVQLSDSEGYSYSVLEALTNDTPVICTPFKSVGESGVVDGKNGYIVPFDMNFDVKRLLDIPKFKDRHSNSEIIEQWRQILGEPKPVTYNPRQTVHIRALREYTDTQLHTFITPGTIYEVSLLRANKIINAGFAERID